MIYTTTDKTELGKVLQLTARRIETRTDGADADGYHWSITLTNRQSGGRMRFEYSQGIGHTYTHQQYRSPGEVVGTRNELVRNINNLKAHCWNSSFELPVDIAIAHNAANPKRGGRYLTAPCKVFVGRGPAMSIHHIRDLGLHREALFRPIPPCLAGVLESLLSEASMADNTLLGFLEDMGYGEDSYRGRQVYQACQSTRGELHGLLPRDMIVKYLVDGENISDDPIYDEDYALYNQEKARPAADRTPVYFDVS